VRNLLAKAVDDRARATELGVLVSKVCASPQERHSFMDSLKWSVGQSTRDAKLTVMLALDTLEHVATICMRSDAPAAQQMLTDARVLMPEEAQVYVLSARMFAVQEKWTDALEMASLAVSKGSVHGLALKATIQAHIARTTNAGYVAGMYDPAILTVSVEPEAKWMLVDLMAVLSTHARLLNEKSLWESPEQSVVSRKQARNLFRRLSKSPFIEATRRQALDVLCFDAADLDSAVDAACAEAAGEHANLGAAYLAGFAAKPSPALELDRDRLSAIEAFVTNFSNRPERSTVLVVFRGDELELVEWARPAALLLRRIAKAGGRFVLVDRTRDARASALVHRIFELAGVVPARKFEARDNPFCLECVTAIVQGRRTPASCPLSPGEQKILRSYSRPEFAALIGRDLDGEIDDLRRYELKTLLVSFRLSSTPKKLAAWMKSLSDVWIGDAL
jgi:hypothetical protein